MVKVKKEIEVTSYRLDNDTAYTIEELDRNVKNYITGMINNYPKDNFFKQITHFKFRARHEYEEWGEDQYTIFEAILYRLETDQELKIRLDTERKNVLKLKEIRDRKILALAKKEENKKKLLEDPDYIKYQELQSKFKNK